MDDEVMLCCNQGSTGIVDVAVIQSLARKGEVDDIVGEYGVRAASRLGGGVSPGPGSFPTYGRPGTSAKRLPVRRVARAALVGESFAL